MGKKKTDRTEIQATKVTGVQDLLKFTEEDNSLAALQEYVIVPFVKIIQGMSEQVLKDAHGEGVAIVRPGDVKIGDKETPFLFVPLFFFTQFRQWCDRKDDIMIKESTYDPNSTIAKNSRDPEKRELIYEGDEDKDKPRKYRFVEHLCFVGIIFDGPYEGTRCLISFQKGDFRVGRAFASGAQMRKVKVEDTRTQVPLWAQVWEMKISLRDRNGNKWWGFDPSNPPEGIEPVISPELFEEHAAAFKELSEAHAANKLRVDGEESDPDEGSSDSNDF